MNRSAPDFRQLFECAPGLYLVLRPDFTILAVNDAYVRATKIVRENVLGRHLFEVFPDNPDDPSADGVARLRSSLERVLATRVPDAMAVQKYDIRRPESEGGGFEVRYWSPLNCPILGPDGAVAGIIHRVEDVTELVRQEDLRKEVERERDLFFSYAFDLLAIVGADGYFKRINPACERVLGYSEAELRARPLAEFLHPDDVGRTARGIEALAQGAPRVASENRYRCKDGAYRWFSWNTTPMGKDFYTVGRDITDQVNDRERIRELNLELARKNEDLEQRIQARMTELKQSEAQVQQLQKMDAVGRLAGGIAHDFNNMLAAITMYCELLEEDADHPEAVRESVRDIRAATESAAALTRQLLVFSRKQVLQLRTVELNPLIRQLEKMLARLIGENVRIETRLAAELRAINADPSQMEQVILNLVVNAKDAMPRGGRILLETSNVYLDEAFTSKHLSVSRGHYVLLSVTDEGTGMDPETLAKIFDPFFTTKPVGKGTGLGLTTAYGIVKQVKGTIWVYSEPGRGTVFKVYLPVAQAPAEVSAAAPAARATGPAGPRTLLLVEDDPGLREGFATILRRQGYNVLVAAGGAEALELCASHRDPIHLLLTDVMMPGLSGFELARRASALRGALRVLYMSGYTDDALEGSGLDPGAPLDFIEKPFDTRALVAKLRAMLEP